MDIGYTLLWAHGSHMLCHGNVHGLSLTKSLYGIKPLQIFVIEMYNENYLILIAYFNEHCSWRQ